jgi:2-keto-4-pentenoate hydratase/2-oxohepta-3-ene-1,7-dioic acid hydratase in catechol pathway
MVWQNRSGQWALSKLFKVRAPFGQRITTSDQITDPQGLDLHTLVNNDVTQQSNSRQLLFDIWAQLAELSQAMTLLTLGNRRASRTQAS